MDFNWKWSALYINLYIKTCFTFTNKQKSGQWFWLWEEKEVNNMRHCCMFESLLYFIMRSRPDWIRNIVHYSFFPLTSLHHSLSLSVILSHGGYWTATFENIFVNAFGGSYLEDYLVFFNKLILKDHKSMHKFRSGKETCCHLLLCDPCIFVLIGFISFSFDLDFFALSCGGEGVSNVLCCPEAVGWTGEFSFIHADAGACISLIGTSNAPTSLLHLLPHTHPPHIYVPLHRHAVYFLEKKTKV